MSNDQKARQIIEATMPHLWTINELLNKVNMVDIDLVRALYLIENIQKLSGYGKVVISVKDGNVISVVSENSFITEKELMRNLKKYKNR